MMDGENLETIGFANPKKEDFISSQFRRSRLSTRGLLGNSAETADKIDFRTLPLPDCRRGGLRLLAARTRVSRSLAGRRRTREYHSMKEVNSQCPCPPGSNSKAAPRRVFLVGNWWVATQRALPVTISRAPATISNTGQVCHHYLVAKQGEKEGREFLVKKIEDV